MFDGFALEKIDIGDVVLRVRYGGRARSLSCSMVIRGPRGRLARSWRFAGRACAPSTLGRSPSRMTFRSLRCSHKATDVRQPRQLVR